MSTVITLLTDFGLRDGYVAAVKGVILSIAPEARLVDITHDIPTQDIYAAAYVLSTSYAYFPKDTIHVVVVDPGVGTERHALLVETPTARFLAPDNGVLSYVLQAYGMGAPVPESANGSQPPIVEMPLPPNLHAFNLANPVYFRPEISRTFHARDIFGPAAAHLSRGAPPDAFGPALDSIHAIAMPRPHRHENGSIDGTVIHVDNFGNLITNVRPEDLPKGDIIISIGESEVRGLRSSYQSNDKSGGELLALFGSGGCLEIAASNGSAAQTLGVKRWAAIQIRPR